MNRNLFWHSYYSIREKVNDVLSDEGYKKPPLNSGNVIDNESVAIDKDDQISGEHN